MIDDARRKPANPKAEMADTGNMQKDPENWGTGDEPMTGAHASERIDRLRSKDPRLNPQERTKKGRR